jgi:hypothetical protein
MPKWLPDMSRPGQLREATQEELHTADCPKAKREYVYETGKKAGQVAANYKYKK